MNYLELTIDTLPGRIEEVAAALTAAGFDDLLLEDQGEIETFLEENRAYWDYIDEDLQEKLKGLSQIKLYLEDTDKEGLARLEGLLQSWRQEKPQWGSLPLTVQALPQTNWEESWKENYPPQPVGEKLLVLPYWLADQVPEDKIPVILDPGLTFGTGAHPSTQMVMAAMEKTLFPGCRCLDLGSGSGILSITALRLGAKSAIGVDIDPKAEDVARENAGYNGLTDFAFYTGNVLSDKTLVNKLQGQTYDFVFVNIVADVIVALAPVLPGFLEKEGKVICSGILDTRLTDVVSALEGAGLVVTQTYAKEDWRCVCVTQGKEDKKKYKGKDLCGAVGV